MAVGPAQVFISAVIFTVGREVAQKTIDNLVPLAKKALENISDFRSSNIQKSYTGEMKDSPVFQDAQILVDALMKMNDQERMQLVRLAYGMAPNDHNQAMNNLVTMLKARNQI